MPHLYKLTLGLFLVFTTLWLGDQSMFLPDGGPIEVVYAAEQTAPAPQLTGCTASGGSGGLAVGTHDVTIAGRPATVIVGQGYDPATPTVLAFYLHGDEGGYDFHTHPSNAINQFINAQSWIYVAPQAPPDPTNAAVFPWDGRNGGSIEGNATLVKAVLDEMFAKYNVCRNLLLGGGVSGGSWFYDAYFFPHHGADYPAYFNLACGASGIKSSWGSWYQNLVAVSQTPAAVAGSELKYTIGTDDFLYDRALDSIVTYTDLGFTVSSEIFPNVAHCAFNTAQEIKDYWESKYILLTTPQLVYLPLVIR